MLKRLKLENFKAWRGADLRFGKVTGFFGTNSAGKSSLLQLLLLLKQTRNATDRSLVLDFGGPYDLVNLGTFKDVVYRHDEQNRMSWLLEWSLPETLRINDPTEGPTVLLFEGDSLQTWCEVGLKQARTWPYELGYQFNEVDFSLQQKKRAGAGFEISAQGTEFNFKRSQGRPKPLASPVKTYMFPSQIRSSYQNADFLFDFELAYEDLMDSIYYLGPLREYPRREYHLGGSRPDDVGQRGEYTMDAMLAATRDGEMRSLGHRKRKKPFQAMIAHWLNELGLIHGFRQKEIAKGTNIYRAMVRTSRSSVETALTDVGFGVSQVLPVLVLLYYVPEGSTVVLEQPEIHLHPSVQSALADVMLSVAKARNVQIIVESHSEHFMRRLQRRVAEGEASAEDVKLYFVSTTRTAAQVDDLALNEWGEIENWPKDFFGNEMGEISAITKSSLKRKLEKLT